MQIESLQEKVDELTAEYSAYAKDRVDLAKNLQEIEKELSEQTAQLNGLTSGSEEHSVMAAKVKDTTAKVAAYKNNMCTLDFKSSACSKRLDVFRTQLEQKQLALKQL